MKLNLGCGFDVLKDWLNVDLGYGLPDGVIAMDLRQMPWAFLNDSAEEIRAIDLVEHLPDTVGFLDECWRVAKPDCILTIRVPHHTSENAYRDPTHVRFFHEDSFDYFDPDTEWGARYPMYSPRKWKILQRYLDGGNIVVKMTPRK